ncbi:hypothetical protein [Frigoriglobus tundricola]|uniref:Uncharacterized protein n=1 Tax=Frigoriglobus tundricola TaxID=2774151 RepID=A0A6M5YKU0_9BACT|nr:hypothetical protein [Frigoriglobus tundricola]QJW94194.1 hypothetical protein FTUN_1713 [Frigoriglobus tundricola]
MELILVFLCLAIGIGQIIKWATSYPTATKVVAKGVFFRLFR